MPRRTPQEDGPENPCDRGKAGTLGVGAVLGPRAAEIAAAAEGLGNSASSSLAKLAAAGGFSIARPGRVPDKFGAEHDVFLAADGLRVFKHARNFGFGPAIKDGMLIMKPSSPHDYLARHALMEQVFPTDG